MRSGRLRCQSPLAARLSIPLHSPTILNVGPIFLLSTHWHRSLFEESPSPPHVLQTPIMNALQTHFWAVREYLSPVLRESKFKEHGRITPGTSKLFHQHIDTCQRC